MANYVNRTILNSPGFNNVQSYVKPGIPYITGSSLLGGHPNNGEFHVKLYRVAKSSTVINRSTTGSICVHFDSRGNTDVINSYHSITVGADDSFSFDGLYKEFFISMEDSTLTGSCQVYVELSNVRHEDMEILSGSGINSAGDGNWLTNWTRAGGR